MRAHINDLGWRRLLPLLFTIHCSWTSQAAKPSALFTSYAQEVRPWERYLNEVMTAEDAESEAWERTCELLYELEQHPLDLNSASREELEELPFLTAQQIEELMDYRYHYGTIRSEGELRMIRSLDEARRRLLTFFTYLGERETKPKRTAKSELTATARIPLDSNDEEKDYLGGPYRHWVRYQLTYGNDVKLGLVAAQDAGEPFFVDKNRWGYDYYSPYLQLKNLGRIETLAVGCYRVSMGMGLVMNNSFGLGKIAMLQNMGRMTNTITAHASRTENYLQGAATTVRFGRNVKATAFVSYGATDATLNKDGTAKTILTSGYHRTRTEIDKKHNLVALKTGGSLRWAPRLTLGQLNLGVNALYVHLDRELKPGTATLYRRHYPEGNDFLNTSVDYGYVHPRWALSGETAIDKQGHLATINTLNVRLTDVLSMMALQRFYSYSYTSLDAQSYSDGGRVQNESGLYVGLTWQPSPALRLTAYADYAYFAWARYRISQTSRSWDGLLQAAYTYRKWNFGARYRLRMKQRDNEDKTALENHWTHRGRLTAAYGDDKGWSFRSQMDGGYGDGEWGMMVSGSLQWARGWLRLNGGGGYYHTDSYDSRVWLYEPGPLYTYSMCQFYGEGVRYWLMARAQVWRQLMLTAKASGPEKPALEVQLRWKF